MATAPEVEFEPDLEIIDLTGETTASEAEDYRGENEEDSSSDPSRAQLRAAIFRVPEARLREVLADLVDTVPAVYHALARELVTVSRTTRVVVPRWETCSNCGETYDVNSDDEECTFHPGKMEVDEEKFDDWDEGCHGPIDTEHTRKEFPENFSWTCCDGDGTTEGCVTGHHSPAVHKKQRV